MRKLLFAAVLCACVSAPSFAAENVVAHSARVAGKDTYKAAKHSVKEAGKFVKFVF